MTTQDGATSESQCSKHKPTRDIPNTKHVGVHQTEGIWPIFRRNTTAGIYSTPSAYPLPTPSISGWDRVIDSGMFLSLDLRAPGAKSTHWSPSHCTVRQHSSQKLSWWFLSSSTSVLMTKFYSQCSYKNFLQNKKGWVEIVTNMHYIQAWNCQGSNSIKRNKNINIEK